MTDSATEERRKERAVEFAMHVLVTAVGGSMGQRLPEEHEARAAVRLGLVLYDEADNPTEPEEADESGPSAQPWPGPDVSDEASALAMLLDPSRVRK